MFLRNLLKAGLVMAALVGGLASVTPGLMPAVRAEVVLPATISPEARDALARMGKTAPAMQGWPYLPASQERLTALPSRATGVHVGMADQPGS
jgi:hypothetical protein